MSTEWEFLEPWCAVLRDSLMPENSEAPESVLDVSFVIPGQLPSARERHIRLELPGPEWSRRDRGRLQQLREAVELFTLVSFVNQPAFQELLFSATTILSEYSLRWTIRLDLNRTASNATAAQTQVTWGDFLGFSDGPWEYSPAAVQKLEAMRVEESNEACSQSKPSIRWTCRLLDNCVDGRQEPHNSADISRSFRAQLQGLFDTMAPPIVRVFATRGCATLVNTYIPTNKPCTFVMATIRNWGYPAVPELAAALARTATACLQLNLECATIGSRQAMMNAGLLLRTLLCGEALRLMSGPSNDSPDDGKLGVACVGVCNRMFSSMCSAVAESCIPVNLSYNPVRSGRWSWLIYALCCGSSDALATSVTISCGELKKSDLLAISAVLQTHYPQPIMYPIGNGSHAYGFADIREGTELYPRVRYGDNDSGFVLSSGCRCRALYDPNDGVSFVNFVVPGYGICIAQLGEGVKFTPESEKTVFPEKRLCGSLALYNSTFETSAVLMEFLMLVTHGLRSLTLFGYGEVTTAAIPIDLCALSTACPELQHLYTAGFNVVVSAHDESLRCWPIKVIAIRDCTNLLSDLTKCLRNPTLRMARQLVELEVKARKNVLNEEEMRELNAHDGEFLPITKEKLPAKSKAAMVSVVTSASCTTKPIRRLDAYILSLIFTFASIPEQRSVKCWCQ